MVKCGHIIPADVLTLGKREIVHLEATLGGIHDWDAICTATLIAVRHALCAHHEAHVCLRHHVAVLVTHEVTQFTLNRSALRDRCEFLIDRWHRGSRVAAVTVAVPVPQQEERVDCVGIGGSPSASLSEVWNHGIVCMCARVADESGVAYLVIKEIIRSRRQILSLIVTVRIRVIGEIIRRGRAGCDRILAIELHKSVAKLVLGYIQLWSRIYPEIVVSRYSREHLRLTL
mmetsp:Transcript_49658/g.98193  ORF Transcript_49658/g.98193 Transcript_49658/m.98193 type:complete len:230 (+) Transcript_49658:261-950(+)